MKAAPILYFYSSASAIVRIFVLLLHEVRARARLKDIMNKSKNHALRIAGNTQALLPTDQETFVVGQKADSADETREERVKRLYASGGGPLMG